ncbi:helix-turn-helix domain-containing protein [Thermosediminibacter litoriperuensis]|uniref:Regulatory Fis family protein n=1 Tax=Thermosediminibacter litoriperuensis TaxID=291989 RepID=A0A5S5AG22_9FIRM|nr:helix-turn-helix domain-containing protein [Thermosediminibacter litoriperuensis]TYP48732.1 regulatory Fis family protein [Thermosediminibacter litoriperuensis]
MGKNVEGIEKDALNILCGYQFKGNVRELQNILERAIVLTDKNILSMDDLPSEVILGSNPISREERNLIPVYIGEDLQTVEKKVILQTLKFFKGNRKETARVLNISERNLRYKIKEYTGEKEDGTRQNLQGRQN